MLMPEIFTLNSNISWLNSIPHSIETVFLGKLLYHGVFNEIHDTYRKRFFKRKLIKAEPVGVWGWNSWCGIHTFPLLTGLTINQILTATYDVGFQRTESSTGLLPHAIVHDKGVFGSQLTYKCYDGIHGEGYNLDNILCWAKMAMEYFLITNDRQWFTSEIFGKITHTIDYILENFRGKFNSALIYAGIEGDWTECTNWAPLEFGVRRSSSNGDRVGRGQRGAGHKNSSVGVRDADGGRKRGCSCTGACVAGAACGDGQGCQTGIDGASKIAAGGAGDLQGGIDHVGADVANGCAVVVLEVYVSRAGRSGGRGIAEAYAG